MRLSCIKLAGFKSFADSTTFQLPGQLVGVVGPNGCGKSNIMDAVRWVLGESRASELRGESMQDVIFNGTNTRKPASRASVELVFDNPDHRGGGQWQQFTEIAVKRTLTRDGTSSYLINNQIVRRKDVHDVFLGTGLGPRAYAIIGQGTINRIIESRPEELRLFLEEAAGVSKYKERRRETEIRLVDTRDNLIRVDDILQELTLQLEKLEQQAAIAQRYNALQAEVTEKKTALWCLQWQDAQKDFDRLHLMHLTAGNALEEKRTQLTQFETQAESLRQHHVTTNSEVHQAQASVYKARAEVSRLEADLRFTQEQIRQHQTRLQNLQIQNLQWQERQNTALQDLESLLAKNNQTEEEQEQLQAQLEQEIEQFSPMEDHLYNLKRTLAEHQQATRQFEQQQQINQLQLRHVQTQSDQAQQQLQKIQHAKTQAQIANDIAWREGMDTDSLNTIDLSTAIEITGEKLTHWQQQQSDNQLQRHALGVQLTQAGEHTQTMHNELNSHTQLQTQLSARLQTLEHVQTQLQTNQPLQPWLQEKNLLNTKPLWQHIQIESGWEMALEVALGQRLFALLVDESQLLDAVQYPPASKLSIYDNHIENEQKNTDTSGKKVPTTNCGLPHLLSKVRHVHIAQQQVLHTSLQHVYCVDSLVQALQFRKKLQIHEIIYTAAGHAVTKTGVDFYARDEDDTARVGLLARAQEIDALKKETKVQDLIAQQKKHQSRTAAQGHDELRQRMQILQDAQNYAQKEEQKVQLQHQKLLQSQQQQQQQQTQWEIDQVELMVQMQHTSVQKEELEDQILVSDEQLQESQAAQQNSQHNLEQHTQRVDGIQKNIRQIERKLQEAEFSHQNLAEQHKQLTKYIASSSQQQVQFDQETQTLEQALNALLSTLDEYKCENKNTDASTAVPSLQFALQQQVDAEHVLLEKNQKLNDLAQQLRDIEQHRIDCNAKLEPLRQQLVDLALRQQAAELSATQYANQLQKQDNPIHKPQMLEILLTLQEKGATKPSTLQQEIDRSQREMTQFGAVNLVAVDELHLAQQRQSFLHDQVQDLQQAIGTLDNAIAKIDAETRDLLRNTFDAVNTHFGSMFPLLFGGGNAKLVMTGEEILNTGVQVVAQPPGKKNQSIQLLSGGEKALTAIALVFAIFKLNPAPFCLLDEVDAPLDDSNTERYAQLVQKMSTETQFLFISHNKIAMQMAQQLIGVTMQEQGVSRVVTVDIASALQSA